MPEIDKSPEVNTNSTIDLLIGKFQACSNSLDFSRHASDLIDNHSDLPNLHLWILLGEFCRYFSLHDATIQCQYQVLCIVASQPPAKNNENAFKIINKIREATCQNQVEIKKNQLVHYAFKEMAQNLEMAYPIKSDQMAWVRQAFSSKTISEKLHNSILCLVKQYKRSDKCDSHVRQLFHHIQYFDMNTCPNIVVPKLWKFIALCTATILFAWHLRTYLPFFTVDVLFPDIEESGGLVLYFWSQTVHTLLLAWIPLLIITWVYARQSASAKNCLNVICPPRFIEPGRIIFLKHVPFNKDIFFHIFQFAWIPFLVICYLFLHSMQSEEMQTILPKSYELVKWPLFKIPSDIYWPPFQAFQEFVIFIVALFGGLWSIQHQNMVQSNRIKNSDTIYWWDKRIQTSEYYVRLTMVFIDMFLIIFIFLKIVYFLIPVLTLLIKGDVGLLTLPEFGKLNFLPPTKFSDLKPVFELLHVLAFFLILVGIFVGVSRYYHSKLVDYRKSNNSLTLILIFVMVFYVFFYIKALDMLTKARVDFLNTQWEVIGNSSAIIKSPEELLLLSAYLDSIAPQFFGMETIIALIVTAGSQIPQMWTYIQKSMKERKKNSLVNVLP